MPSWPTWRDDTDADLADSAHLAKGLGLRRDTRRACASAYVESYFVVELDSTGRLEAARQSTLFRRTSVDAYQPLAAFALTTADCDPYHRGR